MTTRKQTGYCEFNRLVLAYNNFTNLLYESVNVVGHPEIICGNSALRKQDMQPVAGSGDRGRLPQGRALLDVVALGDGETG
jgi:hypothetical protein